MLYATPLITAYVFAVTALVGCVVGSFLNCWAWRIVHGGSIARGRSKCPACGHELAARDLVPLFSWLFSKGKCRYCGKPVSVRYPITEAVGAVIAVSIVARFGLTLECAQMLLFAGALFVLTLTDIDDMIIPNGCLVFALVVRVLYIVAVGVAGTADVTALITDSVIGCVALGGSLLVIVLVADRVLERESMGGGDIKLFAVAGFYFGWMQGLLLVLVSCVIGLLFAALVGLKREKPFPFGPSIALGCWVVALAGPSIVAWYMALM